MFCIGGKVKNSVRAYGLRLLQTVTLRAITFAVAPFARTCTRTRERALRDAQLTLPSPVPRGEPVSILSPLVFVTSENTPDTACAQTAFFSRKTPLTFPLPCPIMGM